MSRVFDRDYFVCGLIVEGYATDGDDLVGCSDDDIAELRRMQGADDLAMDCLQYLKLCGRKVGTFGHGLGLTYPSCSGNKADMFECVEDDMIRAPRSNYVVFAAQQTVWHCIAWDDPATAELFDVRDDGTTALDLSLMEWLFAVGDIEFVRRRWDEPPWRK